MARRYERPRLDKALPREEKARLLQEYVRYYEVSYRDDKTVLNRKLPREAFDDLLGRIGGLLLEESERLARQDGPVRDFLAQNPLPGVMADLLPSQFRVFSLALNALKQWVAAEQAATDRYLLGGTARDTVRSATDICMVTGRRLGRETELHHPVRDGRPPIPLSQQGHDEIEGQSSGPERLDQDDGTFEALRELKRSGNRSWAQLRMGCLALLGEPVPFAVSGAVLNNSRSFAKKASEKTGLDYDSVLALLDERGLGHER